MFLEVILRYFFNSPLMWAESIVKFCLIALSYLGAGMALKIRAHMNILMVWRRLPEKLKPYITIMVDLLVLFFFILFIFYGYKAAIATPGFLWELGNLKKKWLVMILPACGILIVLQGIYIVAEDVYKLNEYNKESSVNN